jgi:leader peptidase (prepilin peptidase)/N-methyltransferase
VITLIVAAGVLGLLFGSFANVCVHRLPRHESIMFPASHCPACSHTISPFDNIPVLAWLWLGGKCRHCSSPISWRYPLLELCMGAGWALLAWHYGFTPLLVGALILCFLLLCLTLIDIETGLLPNALTFPGITLGLIWSFWQGMAWML